MTKPQLLKIEILTGDSRALFKQIIDGIRMEISTGRLPLGSKLPSYRGLAMQLQINPNTVAKAYRELSSEGLIESRAGLGLFVIGSQQVLTNKEREEKLHDAIENLVNETISLNYSDEKIIGALENRLKMIQKLKSA